MKKETRILIVGGGFAGVRTALTLLQHKLPNVIITFIANKPHFEYTPALYRYVTGNSAMEVCVPFEKIFAKKNIEVIQDTVTKIDKVAKHVVGKSEKTYSYDILILALGSETTYFNIPGIQEHSYGMKTVSEALRLRNHINDTLLLCREDMSGGTRLNHDMNFVVIGAGATGVEMSGRLIEYTRKSALEIGVDPALISVTLLEGAEKILPILPANFTDPIARHLKKLGVEIMLGSVVMSQDVEEIFLKDAQMKSSTVIWTSGVRANGLYEASGFPVDKRGKVEVDEYLLVKGEEVIYVAGDGAITQYSGWAQTAFSDGKFVADVIAAKILNKKFPRYKACAPVNAIPAGNGWAAVLMDVFGWKIRFYGRIGWWLRRVADLRSFMLILPISKAVRVFLGGCISEKCIVCNDEKIEAHK